MRDQQKRISQMEVKAGIWKDPSVPDPESWQTLDDLDQMDVNQLQNMVMAELQGFTTSAVLEFADIVCLKKSLIDEKAEYLIPILLEDEKVQHPESRFVQIQHPVNQHWKLIDREKGRIVKSSEQPFHDIPVINIRQ